jgi:O-antigen ligase
MLMAVAVTPLAMAPGLFLGYDVTPKLLVVYLAAAILLLFSGLWWPAAIQLWRTSPGRIFYLLLLAQAGSLFLSSAFSQYPVLAFGGTSSRRLGALTQIVILFIVGALAAQAGDRRSFTRRLLMAIEICAAIAGIYGILQYLGWDPLLPSRLYTIRFTGDIVRPPATLRHAIYFANFLIPVILIAGSQFTGEARLAWRCFHAGVFSIAAAALILTGTRSAIAGLIAGGILFALIEARRIGRKTMLAYVAATVLASAALVSLLLFSAAGQSFRVRMAQWVQDSKGGPRLLVWRDAWPLIRDHWLVGIGPEVFAGEFRKLQSLQLSRAFPDHYHEDPHNLLLGAAINQGVAGCAITCGLIALGMVCAVRVVRNGSPQGAMLLAALVAMTISAQFAPPAITNMLYFYLVIALAVALASPTGSRPMDSSAPAVPRLASRAIRSVAALAIVAAAALYGIPDAWLATAQRRAAHADIAGARGAFRLALRFPFPADSLSFSQQMASAARSLPAPWRQEALAAAKEASADAEQSGEQRFSALYQSATLAIVSGDLANAEKKLRAAVDAAPWWYRSHAMLARLLWLTGRSPEAEGQAALALACAGSQEAAVRTAFESARKEAAMRN